MKLAQSKLDQSKVELYSASPKGDEEVVQNSFYHSNAEFQANPKFANGSIPSDKKQGFVHANYDIGSCMPSLPVGVEAGPGSPHCKNNPRPDHIVSFRDYSTHGGGVKTRLSLDTENMDTSGKIYFILPDGTGLSEEERKIFRKKFGRVSKTQSLGGLYRRIKVSFLLWK